MKDRRELLVLLNDLVDEQITDEQRDRLAELLRGDAEAREYYVQFLQLSSSLRWEYAQAAMPKPEKPTWPSTTKSWFFRASLLLVAASVVFCFVGVWLRWASKRPRIAASRQGIATLVASEGARWHAGEGRRRIGDRFGKGRVSLEAGSAVLQFDNGAKVTLFGPATLAIESGQFAMLESGKVKVRAPEEAIGFTIKTRSVRLTDLGTEFGVIANEDGSSEVHVFDGIVVARPTASDAVIPLLQREAARVDVERGDVVAVDATAGLFPEASKRMPGRRAVPVRVYPRIAAGARIVFVGDRATDRETHLLLVDEVVRGRPERERPKLFNAGVACPFHFTEEELQRYVLSLEPSHVFLEFGSEIAVNDFPMSAEEFRTGLVRFVDHLQRAGVTPLLRTGYPLRGKLVEAKRRLSVYNAIIRELASDRGLRCVETEERFRVDDLDVLLADNGWVPTFAGHRALARTVLDVLGYPKLRVPTTLPLSVLPGVITDWQYRVVPQGEKSDISKLGDVGAWKVLRLPQADDTLLRRYADASHTITYRDRARGFATDLHYARGHKIQAVAWIESEGRREVYFNSGATLRRMWVNGEKIFDRAEWRGWHAGTERVAATLRPGRNRIVIEAGNSFFLSMTDRRDWPLGGRSEAE